MAIKTRLGLTGSPARPYGTFAAKTLAVVVLIAARRIFTMDTVRRVFTKDTDRRLFTKDTIRRIFKTD